MLKFNIFCLFIFCFFLTACGGSGSVDNNRLKQLHIPVQVESLTSGPTISSAGRPEAQLQVTLGNIWLESQMAPPTSTVQASDVAINGVNGYIAYNTFDTNSLNPVKAGAIDHVIPYNCDSLATLTHVDFCLSLQKSLAIPGYDVFSVYANSSTIYAGASTLDETYLPNFARVLKIPLDGASRPSTITDAVVLPSYATTGVTEIGSKLYATTGTSTTIANMGGLSTIDTATLSVTSSINIFDARSVASDPSSTSNVYVLRANNAAAASSSAVEKYSTAATPSLQTSTTVNGNTISESKSTLLVGNQLVIATTGDGGFKILCKATPAAAPLITVAAVGAIGSISAARTVTNSVAVTPGYLFAANGEAGVYAYQFQKTVGNLTSNYCNGIQLTTIGRLKLDSDNNDGTYVMGELSANSLRSAVIVNVLNVITNRFIYVASGNKGISLLNLSELTLLSRPVDDFP